MDLGSLADLLKNESMVLDGEIIAPILRDVSSGVRFLHSSKPPVVHGDLKGQNVLVDGRFRAKVTDFGLSHKSKCTKTANVAGTPFWMAPELLREESSNTTESDIYAFGVVIFEIFSRKEPYQGERPSAVLKLVKDKEVRKRPKMPDQCPPEIISLVSSCYEDDPALRPTAAAIDMMFKQIDPEKIDKHLGNNKKSKAARTEDLLYQLFPRHMADALRDGEKVPPEQHDMVTVYFSDVVGYTSISSKLEATKVTDFLDRLYHKFDLLCVKHGVFKVSAHVLRSSPQIYIPTCSHSLKQSGKSSFVCKLRPTSWTYPQILQRRVSLRHESRRQARRPCFSHGSVRFGYHRCCE